MSQKHTVVRVVVAVVLTLSVLFTPGCQQRREDSSMVESFTAVRTQLCKLHVTLYCD